MNIFEELKKIVAEADAKIQAVLQPAVESGSQSIVAVGMKALDMVQKPIKEIMLSLDKGWTDEEKAERLKEYGEKGLPESPKEV